MYRAFRYVVFGSFIICNAVVVTSAIWNLSLVLGRGQAAAVRSGYYSTFLGSAGLIFIFPIFFCEIANRDTFVTKVWFELIWVAVFCVLGLVGAAITTVVGADNLCRPLEGVEQLTSPRCISNRLLQGAWWMGSLILLCYFLLLAVFTLLQSREDGTIWHCYVRRFPWTSSQSQLPSTPLSPTGMVQRKSSKFSKVSLRRILTRSSGKPPTIAAPRPRRAANDLAMQQGILCHRSGLSLEYEIEHLKPGSRPIVRPEAAFMIEEKHQAPIMPVQATTPPSHSLYPEYMRAAMAQASSQNQVPLEFSPAPNPLGNWPQLNPPVRRLGGHRNDAMSGTQVGATANYPPISPTSHHTRPVGPRRPSISYGQQPGVGRTRRTLPHEPFGWSMGL